VHLFGPLNPAPRGTSRARTGRRRRSAIDQQEQRQPSDVRGRRVDAKHPTQSREIATRPLSLVGVTRPATIPLTSGRYRADLSACRLPFGSRAACAINAERGAFPRYSLRRLHLVNSFLFPAIPSPPARPFERPCPRVRPLTLIATLPA
jgi:hypothetical protein